MIEEKKFCGGGTPELNDAALDDDALEAVAGGTKPPEQKSWADQARDFAKEMFGVDTDKEEQP